jgi:hypothetical protein
VPSKSPKQTAKKLELVDKTIEAAVREISGPTHP